MANEVHLKWLLAGPASWNGRRREHPFQPELREADLRGADLWRADLQGADLWEADLRRADLREAILRDADLRRADLRRADLRNVALERANLRRADLRNAALERADLRRADLREGHLGSTHLLEAELSGADVRSYDILDGKLLNLRASTVNGTAPEYRTDLSEVLYLTQAQLESMRGDRWTIIPSHLTRPAHWLDEGDTGESGGPAPEDPAEAGTWDASRWDQASWGADTPKDGAATSAPTATATIQARLRVNHKAVVLGGASVLEQIAEYRERARGNNQLDPEQRDELLGFLDRLAESTRGLVESVPDAGEEPTAEDAERTATWFDRFRGTCSEDFSERFTPETLGKAAVPLGIILGCGAIGAALSGGIGFGAGSLFGKLLTGHLKPDAAADQVGDALKGPPDPTPE